MRPLVLSLVVLLLCGAASADNLVVNGGFETGNFTGWTITGQNTFGTDYGRTHQTPFGVWAAWFGAVNGMTYISQWIPTTPGATYDLSFWGANVSSGTPQNEFQFYWGGVQLLDAVNIGAQGWAQEAGQVQATTSSTQIMFGLHNGPGYWLLDGISVSTPEPSAMILCTLGLCLVALRRRP